MREIAVADDADSRDAPAAWEIVLADEAATDRLGAALAGMARGGDVLALWGELGAGKTRLARAFIGALTGESDIPSPTFTLVQTYETAIGTVWHFDLYRLSAAGETAELGIEDALADGVALIEWPDRLDAALPRRRLDVALAFTGAGEARKASLRARGGQWADRLGRLRLDAA
jgi:tRNA threonylcarbamoyladenosine biosynthesis protein TsaE